MPLQWQPPPWPRPAQHAFPQLTWSVVTAAEPLASVTQRCTRHRPTTSSSPIHTAGRNLHVDFSSPTWSVVISAEPLASRAVISTGAPGSLAAAAVGAHPACTLASAAWSPLGAVRAYACAAPLTDRAAGTATLDTSAGQRAGELLAPSLYVRRWCAACGVAASSRWVQPSHSAPDRGMRSQLLPPSVVCSRMAGLPTIQPSSPLKEMELKRKLKPSS